MRRENFVSCATVIMLLAVSVGAQVSRHFAGQITADVPFDFMIEQSMFPAGRYIVTRTGDQSLHLRAQQGLESATFLLDWMPADGYEHEARLIFSKENGHFQLRQVWINAKLRGEVSAPPITKLRDVSASRVEVFATCTDCE